tara:strand:+ start:3209 stop:3391 length:183 start_codon:yes stop_codon:yes gene_type:complete
MSWTTAHDTRNEAIKQAKARHKVEPDEAFRVVEKDTHYVVQPSVWSLLPWDKTVTVIGLD